MKMNLFSIFVSIGLEECKALDVTMRCYCNILKGGFGDLRTWMFLFYFFSIKPARILGDTIISCFLYVVEF